MLFEVDLKWLDIPNLCNIKDKILLMNIYFLITLSRLDLGMGLLHYQSYMGLKTNNIKNCVKSCWFIKEEFKITRNCHKD